MNPRRIHELMRTNFPEVNPASRDWTVVQGLQGADREAIGELLKRHLPDEEVLIEVNRKVGAMLSVEEAIEFIACHIGEDEIRVSDRHFLGFVVVARNGVATGWQHAG